MTTSRIEQLLEQADREASNGEWQASFNALAQITAMDPGHAGAITGQGSCLIQMGRLPEALPYFQRAAAAAPDSPETHNNLGVVLASSGQLWEAEAAYQNAVELDPDYAQAWKNLAALYLQQDRMEEGVSILAAVVQADPQDAEALFLLARCYEEGEEYTSARLLYEQVLKCQPDNLDAETALRRLPVQAPDPTRIARPEHAKKLAALKSLVKEIDPSLSPLTHPGRQDEGARPPRPPAIAFYGPPEPATEMRLGPVISSLADQGCKIKISLAFSRDDLENFDTFVFARPHSSAELMEAVRRCSAAGKHTVIDIDEDFHHLPAGHPAFDQAGPGNPQSLAALEACLSLAEAVIVPAPALKERYQRFAQTVEVLPNCWSSGNSLWDKPAQPRSTLNIGVFSTHILATDGALVKNSLARLMKEIPEALLVIGGDLRLYEAFSNIAEDRRLFLPPGRIEDYPYMLSNVDILLVPLTDNTYNQTKSDLPLLEAGIRRIPWAATPIPSFKDWEAGGCLVEKRADWYRVLRTLAKDPGLRARLGEEGRAKAEARECHTPFFSAAFRSIHHGSPGA